MKRSDSITVAPESTAWILVNDHEVEIFKNGKTKRHIKRAVKLLNSSGIEYMTLFESISSWREIKNVKGWHIDSDGQVEKLEKDNIIQVASDLSAGYYDDAMRYIAAFEDVKTGDVVAFEYTLTEESNWDSYFQSFEIQIQQPVMFSRFYIKIPDGWELHKGSHYAQVCKYEENNNKYCWTATDLPYQPDEELMPPWYYMTRNIKVSCFDPNEKKDYNFTSWKDAAVWAKKYLSSAVKPNQAIIDYVNEHINVLPDSEQKLKAISEFVRDEIRYVAVEIGKGRFIPRKAAKTFYNRYGDCKDKVALMRTMLHVANIPSVSVLASVGNYVDPGLPSPLQFDHCIIGIDIDSIPDIAPMPNATVNGWFFFDPTDPAQHVGELPIQLYGSKVLIAGDLDSSLIKIPYISPDKNHRKYVVRAYLDNTGQMSSTVTIIDYGAKALATAYWLSKTKTEKTEDIYKRKYSDLLPSLKLTDFLFENNNDSTWIQFNLEQGNYIIKSEELRFLPIDFIYEGRLPVLKKKERVHPIWFGGFKKIDIEIDWTFGDSWKIELEPDSIRAECEVVTYSFDLEQIENNIKIKSLYTSDGGLIDKEKYKDARKFRRSLSKGRGMKLKLLYIK